MPSKDYLVDYGNTIKRVLKGVAKLHPYNAHSRLPLLSLHMRSIRYMIRLSELEDAKLWALWPSQWQVVVSGSDILRPTNQKARKWDLTKDTNIGRLQWEVVDQKTHHGCDMRLRWSMKSRKTDQSGEESFKKTFSVDHDNYVLSAAANIEFMLTIRRRYGKNNPISNDPNTGKEPTVARSRQTLAE